MNQLFKQEAMQRIFILIFLSFAFFSCEKDQDVSVHQHFSGGDGTQSNPYLIGSAEDLNNVRDFANRDIYKRGVYFKQIADIDLSVFSHGKGWEPIERFTQNYDGNGYTISNLTINRPNEGNVGLFRKVDVDFSNWFEGVIRNVTLNNVHIIGGYETGSLAGRNSGTFINCNATGKIEATGREGYRGAIGGLAGINNGYIHNSHATIEIKLAEGFSFSAGGLAGILSGSSVIQSFAGGRIILSDNEGSYQIAGGLAGMTLAWPGSDVISDSYAFTELINGNGQIMGGMLGQSYGNTIIINSYASGFVSPKGEKTGGLVGDDIYRLYVKDSYWDKNTTGQEASAGSTPDFGKTTHEMKMQETFHTWDFENVWKINEGISYPTLIWQ